MSDTSDRDKPADAASGGSAPSEPPKKGNVLENNAKSSESSKPGNASGGRANRPANGEPERPAKNGSKPKRWPLWILLVLVVVGGSFGVYRFIYSLSHEWSDDAFIDGTIIQISPRVAGHVSNVYVRSNQRVTSGTLLLAIDPRPFETQVAQARAALDVALAARKAAHVNVDLTRVSADSNLKAGEAGVAGAQAALAAAKNRLEQAQAQENSAKADVEKERETAVADQALATKADADLKRFRTLREKNVIAQQELDGATATATAATATLQSQQRKVAGMEADLADSTAARKAAEQAQRQAESALAQARAALAKAQSAPQQIEAAQAQASKADAAVNQARAALQQAQLDLSYTKVHAPSDGFVTKKSIDPGDYVMTGQALMALVTPDVFVTANFKETQLTDMRPGQPATIEVDAYPGVTFKGHVDSIQHGSGARFSLLPPENATGNYVKVVQRVPVKILFDGNPGAKYLLGPGMSAVPTVTTK